MITRSTHYDRDPVCRHRQRNRKLCKIWQRLQKTPALSRYRRRAYWRRNHDLCPRCFRAARNRFRSRQLMTSSGNVFNELRRKDIHVQS